MLTYKNDVAAWQACAEYLFSAIESGLLCSDEFVFEPSGLCRKSETASQSRFTKAIKSFFDNCSDDTQREIIAEASYSDPNRFVRFPWVCIGEYLQGAINEDIKHYLGGIHER